jgi:hypothetical protein
MPTVSEFYGITICVLWEDQAPPHFRANYDGQEAIIDIEALAMLRGEFPARGMEMVLEWAAEHRAELLEAWEACRRGEPPQRISPLR